LVVLLFLFIEILRNVDLSWILVVAILCFVLLMVGMFSMHKKGSVKSSATFLLFGLTIIIYNVIKYFFEKQFNVVFLGEFVISALALYGGFKIRK